MQPATRVERLGPDQPIARLAAEFCLPVTETTTRSEALAVAAEAEFRRAKLIDAQQEVASGIEDFTLVGARL